MTINLKGRKASLYATAVAISLVALSGTAGAATANGQYKASALPTSEAPSSVVKSSTTKATLTTEQINASTTLTLAQKQAALKANEIVKSLTASQSAALKAAFETAKLAKADLTAKTTAAANALAKLSGGSVVSGAVTTTYYDTEAALTAAGASTATQKNVASTNLLKIQADNAVAAYTAVGGAKTVADEAVVQKQGQLVQAQTAKANAIAAAVTPLSAQAIAGYDADIAAATQAVNFAVAEQTAVSAAYNSAVALANSRTTAYTTAITNQSVLDNAKTTAIAAETIASTNVTAALVADTAFEAARVAVNTAAGTTFASSYLGLVAIENADDQPLDTPYGSNGYTRTTASLAAGAASANANIVMATAALTDGAAALEAGANFETEVLSVLVNHETRITTNATNIAANTTAIAALDVRTTANTTAIAALDVRTTANTTAIANEVTARVAADNALGARITAETDARIAADNLLRDQIASSTATAIAMGGAALLPDMGFTLSGNIAVYEGAQAMALNAAAKVGANAYVTAAVGGGLNKNGSVGGRVGFVFGF